MKKLIFTLLFMLLAGFVYVVFAATFQVKIIDLGGGQIQVVSENIPLTASGDRVESSTNLIDWTPVATNGLGVNGWVTNTFQITNSVIFYRARLGR
jgi:hypothetical protein